MRNYLVQPHFKGIETQAGIALPKIIHMLVARPERELKSDSYSCAFYFTKMSWRNSRSPRALEISSQIISHLMK